MRKQKEAGLRQAVGEEGWGGGSAPELEGAWEDSRQQEEALLVKCSVKLPLATP